MARMRAPGRGERWLLTGSQCQHHRSWGGASTRRRWSDTPSTQPVPAQAPASCPLTQQARATASTRPPNSGCANAAAHQPERRKPDAGPLHSFASPRVSQTVGRRQARSPRRHGPRRLRGFRLPGIACPATTPDVRLRRVCCRRSRDALVVALRRRELLVMPTPARGRPCRTQRSPARVPEAVGGRLRDAPPDRRHRDARRVRRRAARDGGERDPREAVGWIWPRPLQELCAGFRTIGHFPPPRATQRREPRGERRPRPSEPGTAPLDAIRPGQCRRPGCPAWSAAR